MSTGAVGYVRVSSEEQAKGGISLEMQATKIRAYCELNDLNLVELVADEGISAKDIEHRPGFLRCLEMLDNEQVDTLIVWRVDRAFRSTIDALTVRNTMERKGQTLISITDPVETSTASGKLQYGIKAVLNEYERDLISERTKAALEQKRANREKTGGVVPYGFRIASDGIHLEIDPEEAQVVALVLDLHEAGVSYRGIAKRLNQDGYTTKTGHPWNHRTVGRVFAVTLKWAA